MLSNGGNRNLTRLEDKNAAKKTEEDENRFYMKSSNG